MSSPDAVPAPPTVSVVVTEPDADPERIETLTRYLLSDLRDLDEVEATPAVAGTAPEGAKSADLITLGGLVITLLSAQAIPNVIAVIRLWLDRRTDPGRRVRLELGGDVLELSSVSAADQERLVAEFLARHHPSRSP